MRLETYLDCTLYEGEISYEQFCEGIDYAVTMDEGLLDTIKDAAVSYISKAFKAVSEDFEEIVKNFGIGMSEIVKAFKERSFFNMMKALGFNFTTLIKSVHATTGLIQKGLFKVFEDISKSKVFDAINKGAKKIDDVLDQYPILRKVSGPAVAGLLFYIWLNMTFIGHFDYDFDFSDMAAALVGRFSLADLFASPAGMMLMTLFATGSIISAPWLGQATYNLVLAIFYTLYKKVRGAEHGTLSSIKSKIKFVNL